MNSWKHRYNNYISDGNVKELIRAYMLYNEEGESQISFPWGELIIAVNNVTDYDSKKIFKLAQEFKHEFKIEIINKFLELMNFKQICTTSETRFICNATNITELAERVKKLEETQEQMLEFIKKHLAYMPDSDEAQKAAEDFTKLSKTYTP